MADYELAAAIEKVARAIEKAGNAHAKATIIAARIAANTEARSRGVRDNLSLPYPTPEDVRLP